MISRYILLVMVLGAVFLVLTGTGVNTASADLSSTVSCVPPLTPVKGECRDIRVYCSMLEWFLGGKPEDHPEENNYNQPVNPNYDFYHENCVAPSSKTTMVAFKAPDQAIDNPILNHYKEIDDNSKPGTEDEATMSAATRSASSNQNQATAATSNASNHASSQNKPLTAQSNSKPTTSSPIVSVSSSPSSNAVVQLQGGSTAPTIQNGVSTPSHVVAPSAVVSKTISTMVRLWLHYLFQNFMSW